MANDNVFAAILSGIGQANQAAQGWYQLGAQGKQFKDELAFKKDESEESRRLQREQLKQSAEQFARGAQLQEDQFGLQKEQIKLDQQQLAETAKAALMSNREGFREAQIGQPIKGFEDLQTRLQGKTFEDIYTVSPEGITSIKDPNLATDIKRYQTELGKIGKIKDEERYANMFAGILAQNAAANVATTGTGTTTTATTEPGVAQQAIKPIKFLMPTTKMEPYGKPEYKVWSSGLHASWQQPQRPVVSGFEEIVLPVSNQEQLTRAIKDLGLTQLSKNKYGVPLGASKGRLMGAWRQFGMAPKTETLEDKYKKTIMGVK